MGRPLDRPRTARTHRVAPEEAGPHGQAARPGEELACMLRAIQHMARDFDAVLQYCKNHEHSRHKVPVFEQRLGALNRVAVHLRQGGGVAAAWTLLNQLDPFLAEQLQRCVGSEIEAG